MRTLTKQQVEAFKNSLALDEKSKATIQKYMRDVHAFYAFILGKEIEKEQMIAYKKHLLEQHYAVRTVNSMLCSINRLMHFLGWEDCIVKGLRLQRQIYQSEQKELTKAEYHRLLRAAEHKPRLQMILKTIGCTGIRVSELQYFTVESVKKRKILISCKGKIRTILLPSMLQKRLLNYCRQYNIHNGLAFCTRSGKPLDRSNIWTAMKKLCAAKVYTYQIDIDKYTGEYGTDGKTATHLAGATFQLKNSNATGATPIDLVAEANAEDGSLVYHIKGTDETTATAVTDVTTPENGKITIKGLKAGTYYLYETAAPSGYNKLTKPVTVVITADNADLTNFTYTINDKASAAKNATVPVQNNKGQMLPTTGSMGTIGLVALGVAVVLIGVFMPRKKKANR